MSPFSDYEEDFEADDEGPAEDEEKKSPSPSRERQRQVKERDTSETEDDEKDGGWNILSEHVLHENQMTELKASFIHLTTAFKTAKQNHSVYFQWLFC